MKSSDVISNRLQFIPKRIGIETITRTPDIYNVPTREINYGLSILNLSFVSNLNNSQNVYLTIVPRARMASESIAHEAFGLMGY